MNPYLKILELTKRIETSLSGDDLSGNLNDLIEERGGLFADLQTDEKQENSTDADLIMKIRECEERCVTLAQAKKQMIKKEIKNTQNNKQRHTAYSRQMASTY